jgi:hypothetical protein
MRDAAALKSLLDGDDPRHINEDWQDADVKFEAARAPYLLYGAGKE